ncbi:MAG: phage holin family protein, partial [Pseudomonadota bacterium]
SADPLTPVSAPETQDDGVEELRFDESVVDELAALIDDGRTYAEAELAFQKARASIAGRSIGMAIGFAIVAIILLHIAFLALAVGLVIALSPLVTTWGAIAIVVGGLLFAVGLLGFGAFRKGKLLAALFANADKESEE